MVWLLDSNCKHNQCEWSQGKQSDSQWTTEILWCICSNFQLCGTA